MHKRSAMFLAALLVVALAGCGQTGTTSSSSVPSTGSTTVAPATPAAPAAPTGAAVWTATLSTKAYQSWQKAPGYDTPQTAKGPHGKQVEIFVDPNIVKTLAGPAVTTWPTGSKIVKEALDAGGALVGYNYMEKTDQGWFYSFYDPTGKILKEGVEVAPCAPCHKTGSDSVKSFKLPGGSGY